MHLFENGVLVPEQVATLSDREETSDSGGAVGRLPHEVGKADKLPPRAQMVGGVGLVEPRKELQHRLHNATTETHCEWSLPLAAERRTSLMAHV